MDISFSASIAVEAFFFGLSLIIPIGLQNAYILRQGIQGEYYLVAALMCSLCDSILIFVGSMGLASIFVSNTYLRYTALTGGILFLTCYSIKFLRRALVPLDSQGSMNETFSPVNLKAVIISALTFSFLNPHAILDAMIIIGGVAAQHTEFSDRFSFTLGACCASWVWFFSLSCFGKLLRPIFKKPITIRILDGFVSMVMFTIVVLIIQSELQS